MEEKTKKKRPMWLYVHMDTAYDPEEYDAMLFKTKRSAQAYFFEQLSHRFSLTTPIKNVRELKKILREKGLLPIPGKETFGDMENAYANDTSVRVYEEEGFPSIWEVQPIYPKQ